VSASTRLSVPELKPQSPDPFVQQVGVDYRLRSAQTTRFDFNWRLRDWSMLWTEEEIRLGNLPPKTGNATPREPGDA